MLGFLLRKEFFMQITIGKFTFRLNKQRKTAVITKFNSDKKDVNIPNSITHNGMDYPIIAIEDKAFSNCVWLERISIPGSVTSIGDYAFCECTSLKTVDIPDSVTSIGDDAFRDCINLESISIPGDVTKIGELAFCNCTNLKSIDIPDSVTSIGKRAFKKTPLEHIVVENGLRYVLCDVTHTARVHSVFVETEDIVISDNINYNGVFYPVASIEDYAFQKCKILKSITIPDSVTSIGRDAFSECASLKSINIPNGVTEIGNGAFYYCHSLKNINISGSVARIGGFAFGGCNSLKSISIPDSVTNIGESAFYGCSSLTEIIIPGSEKAFPLWVSLMDSKYADLVKLV